MSHSGDSLCAPQPAARWKKQCYQKKTCGKPLCPSPQHTIITAKPRSGKIQSCAWCISCHAKTVDCTERLAGATCRTALSLPSTLLLWCLNCATKGAWSRILLLHSCHHPTTWTVLPEPSRAAIHSSFRFLPLLSQLRMAKWRGQPGTIYTIIGMEISQSAGKYQSTGKRDRSSQRSFVLPTQLLSLISACCSVSHPLTSTADVYCLLRKMLSINMKEVTFLLITIDCSGLWLASQVLTAKEVLYLWYNYAASQTSNPLAKIRAIFHPLVLLRSGPYIDRWLPYFPQHSIGILQLHSVKCDLPLWFFFLKQTSYYMNVTFL